MSEPFDAYYKWLAIPPEEQPPNHYRLLGVRLYESDPDVISNAADRQMAHVRTYQTGRHAALSQKVLNEIATAKLTLLQPDRKVPYDARLRQSLAPPAAAPPPSVAPPMAPPAPAAPYAMPTVMTPRAASEAGRMPMPASAYTMPSPRLQSVAVAPVVQEPAASFVTSYPRTRRRRQSSSMPVVLLFGGLALVAAIVLIALKPWERSALPPTNKPKATAGTDVNTSADRAAHANSSDPGARATEQPSTTTPKPTISPAEMATLVTQVRQAVMAGNLVRHNAAGGPSGSMFEDLPQPAELLIGFDYSLGRDNEHDVVQALRPLYRVQSTSGIRAGSMYGKDEGSKRLAAPAGYAVGRIRLWAGAGIDALELEFMRITPEGLDRTDVKRTKRIGGGNGSGPVEQGGDGKPLVGISGRAVDTRLHALGLIGIADLHAAPEVKPSETVPSQPSARPVQSPADVPLNLSKTPAPTAAALLPARKQMRDRYQKDFDEATTMPRKAALAEKLLKDAELEMDDALARFVLLDEVRKRATEAGQSDFVVAAIKALDAHYEIDFPEMMAATLTDVEKAETFATDKRKLAENALVQFEIALAGGKTEIADRLIAVAHKAAAKANDPDLLQQVLARRRKFREQTP